MPPDSGLIVGLYASTPDPLGTDGEPDARLISLARSTIPHVRGLEIPFYGRDGIGEKYAQPNVLNALDSSFVNIVTAIPSTVIHQQLDPMFGLASINDESRAAAVAKTKMASLLIRRINDRAGKCAVSQINVCSGPSSSLAVDRTSMAALRRSLEELLSHDWDGAALNIEHCDSKRGKSLEKAYLSIEEELSAAHEASTGAAKCGMVINWGRSAIEHRDPRKVIDHIALAVGSDVLNGLMFSGVSDRADSAYGSWKDLHPSVAFDPDIEQYVPESLLTAEEIASCLAGAQAGHPSVVGFKIHLRPIANYDTQAAAQFNRDMSRILHREMQRMVPQ